MSFIFWFWFPDFLALAFGGLSDIANNNPFDDLYEFISILANAKKMTFVRQSHPNKGRLG
ncbi:hypothetical protein [Flavobacterium sp. LB1P71]|uniref:hypothetical protein n=1 Tax=unclassified Flavobacterium TaxID=196869 RepID=UPI003AB018A3